MGFKTDMRGECGPISDAPRPCMYVQYTRKLFYHLSTITVFILMDISLLRIEFANLHIIKAIFKGVAHSIKLKPEPAVLGKLVHFVITNLLGSGLSLSTMTRTLTMKYKNLSCPSRSPSDVTRVTVPGGKKSRGDLSASDLSPSNLNT